MAYAPEPRSHGRRPEPTPAAEPEAAPTTAAPRQAGRRTRPAQRTRTPTSVLNDAQIASIKRRLALTREQERYWPAVEARCARWPGRRRPATRAAKVDMSTVDIDGLKSAAFPLVMSFSDDQKRELRSLANLMGLESVASRF